MYLVVCSVFFIWFKGNFVSFYAMAYHCQQYKLYTPFLASFALALIHSKFILQNRMENQNRCWLLSWIPHTRDQIWLWLNIIQSGCSLPLPYRTFNSTFSKDILRFYGICCCCQFCCCRCSKFLISFLLCGQIELHRMVAKFSDVRMWMCVSECVYSSIGYSKPTYSFPHMQGCTNVYVCLTWNLIYLVYLVFVLVLLACLRFIRFYCKQQQKQVGKKYAYTKLPFFLWTVSFSLLFFSCGWNGVYSNADKRRANVYKTYNFSSFCWHFISKGVWIIMSRNTTIFRGNSVWIKSLYLVPNANMWLHSHMCVCVHVRLPLRLYVCVWIMDVC